jgi:hypothetical protein
MSNSRYFHPSRQWASRASGAQNVCLRQPVCEQRFRAICVAEDETATVLSRQSLETLAEDCNVLGAVDAVDSRQFGVNLDRAPAWD